MPSAPSCSVSAIPKQRTVLPRRALGIGLRVQHYGQLSEHWPTLDYLEVITDNFLTEAALPAHTLKQICKRYPVVLHGVGLNLLGCDPLDENYLDAVCRLADRVDASFVTDHLCWTGAHGVQHHDLLPTPYVPALVDMAASRAYAVQRRLGRPFGLENLSSYVSFAASTLTECEFYASVVREAGCYFMLDINNIYVSSVNHGFDASDYLRAIDFERVLQVHMAGHSVEPTGMIVDTHAAPVAVPVLQLYADAWRMGGPFPTLLEWDDAIPPLHDVVTELTRIGAARGPCP